MNLTARDRGRRIRVILFDVDGVLTDGSLWFLPPGGVDPGWEGEPRNAEQDGAVPAGRLIEAKGFHAHDGSGIALARLGGIRCGILTRRQSLTVAQRARDLRLDYVYMGQQDKMQAVHEILQKDSLSIEEIAYVGDDVIDLPIMRGCGLAIAVSDARPQVKAAAHYITPSRGGRGAGRDAVEFILESQGILEECIEKYIGQ